VSSSIALETLRPANPLAGVSRVVRNAAPRARTRTASQTFVGLLDDALWLVFAVLMIPIAILVVGTPIALFARLLVEIVQRF
jgi:hypothetical protein